MSRTDLLGQHDLRDLMDQYVGPGRGRGTMATWPCPAPGHGPQTGRTPPVSVFTGRTGEQRWKCHGCGTGGTAIDLIQTVTGGSVREAFEALGAPVLDPPSRPSWQRPGIPTPIPGDALDTRVLERWVAASERRLWEPTGAHAREWLTNRGLNEPVLRANRIGFDPGAGRRGKTVGIPGTAGVVLPVLDWAGRAVYAQLRNFGAPTAPKYLNPSSQVAAMPAVAPVRPPADPHTRQAVFVCEGIIDALTVAQAGWRACAVLGASNTSPRVAAELLARYPGRNLIVAFDTDTAGQTGAQRLHDALTKAGGAGMSQTIDVPDKAGDINGWLTGIGPQSLTAGLGAVAGMVAPCIGTTVQSCAIEP